MPSLKDYSDHLSQRMRAAGDRYQVYGPPRVAEHESRTPDTTLHPLMARDWGMTRELPQARPRYAKGGVVGKISLNDLRDKMADALRRHVVQPYDSPAAIASSTDAANMVGSYLGVLKKTGQARPLLTTNSKLAKAEKGVRGEPPIILPNGRGVQTTGMALAPAFEYRGLDTCPMGQGCKRDCLGKTSGGFYIYGGGEDMEARKGPRLDGVNRTLAMMDEPAKFAVRLHDEIMARKLAILRDAELPTADGRKKDPDQLGIRLNVVSDIAPKIWKPLMETHPDVQFFDYTKLNSQPVNDNHHLTFSSTGVSQSPETNGCPGYVHNPHQNWGLARSKLDRGLNVAMPFAHPEVLPTHLHDQETGRVYRIVSGDDHDYRPMDEVPPGQPGVIIGLKNKSEVATRNPALAAERSNGFFTHFDPGVILDAKGKPLRHPPREGEKQGALVVPPTRPVYVAKQAKPGKNVDNEGKELR